MVINNLQSTTLQGNLIYYLLKEAANNKDVREHVFANHDDNKWWPTYVRDWRLRMVIAGWSSRISYSMIQTYMDVVNRCNEISFDRLVTLNDNELKILIKPLGLFKTRITYFRTLVNIIDEIEKQPQNVNYYSNDDLVEYIQNNVDSAGYKVGQCAALYAKGYHCGIMPVDSGMVEMLTPCLGIRIPSGPIAHEIIRKILESSIRQNKERYRHLMKNLGYSDLLIPSNVPPTWWAHLALIYYKRLYWNKGRSSLLFRNEAEPYNSESAGSPIHELSKSSKNFVFVIGDDEKGIERLLSAFSNAGYVVTNHLTKPTFTPNPETQVKSVVNLAKLTSPEINNLIKAFNFAVNSSKPVILCLCKSKTSLYEFDKNINTKETQKTFETYIFISPFISTALMCSVLCNFHE